MRIRGDRDQRRSYWAGAVPVVAKPHRVHEVRRGHRPKVKRGRMDEGGQLVCAVTDAMMPGKAARARGST